MGMISSTSMTGVWASIGVLGGLFRTKEVQKVLACIASEEKALLLTAGPELLFGYRLAKRHVRDAVVAQSIEITDKIRDRKSVV